MSDCNFTTEIDRDWCIGDSRPYINENFSNLDTAVCTISTTYVSQIKAGSNIVISPTSGIGVVTINSTMTYPKLAKVDTHISAWNGSNSGVYTSIVSNVHSLGISSNGYGISITTPGVYEIETSYGGIRAANAAWDTAIDVMTYNQLYVYQYSVNALYSAPAGGIYAKYGIGGVAAAESIAPNLKVHVIVTSSAAAYISFYRYVYQTYASLGVWATGNSSVYISKLD